MKTITVCALFITVLILVVGTDAEKTAAAKPAATKPAETKAEEKKEEEEKKEKKHRNILSPPDIVEAWDKHLDKMSARIGHYTEELYKGVKHVLDRSKGLVNGAADAIKDKLQPKKP